MAKTAKKYVISLQCWGLKSCKNIGCLEKISTIWFVGYFPFEMKNVVKNGKIQLNQKQHTNSDGFLNCNELWLNCSKLFYNFGKMICDISFHVECFL